MSLQFLAIREKKLNMRRIPSPTSRLTTLPAVWPLALVNSDTAPGQFSPFWGIAGVIALIALQALFIVWLLLNRAKRRKAEEASKAIEERYRNVVETQTELICRYQDDATLTFVNDAYCRYFGRTREQLIGTKFTQLLPEHAREAALSHVASLIENPRAETYEHEVVLSNGEIGWQQWVDHVVERNGHGVELQGVGRDITERLQAEEALRQSEAQFRHMADTSPVLIWISDAQPQVTFVNKQCTDFTGQSMEAMLGEGWLEFVHEDDRQRCIDIYMAAYQRREPFVYEYRIRHADGEFHWLYSTSAPRFASDGEFLGYIGSCVDITDRKLAEEAVRESEEKFRTMADTSEVLIWIADTDMLCTFFNQKVLDFTGRSTEELCGEGWLEIVHQDDRQRSIDAYTFGYERKEPFVLEYRMRRADGEWRWVYDTGAPRFASNGEFLGYIGSAVDITEWRRAQEELRLSETRFSIMADAAPVMIWMSGPDNLSTYVNQGWLDFTGRTLEQELGNGWTEGIHADDRDNCLEIYKSAFDRREPFLKEYRLRRHDGSFRWIYDTGTPRFSSEGDFLGYIGSCIDITDRKEAEQNLQIAHAEVNKLKNQLEAENIYLQEEIRLSHHVDEIVGQSNAIKYVFFKIEQVAQTDTSVLILGETGTGKELVARAIHSQSSRKDRPLVKVNCAALSSSLIESELFGHEKGAFTGASARKIGRFELADGATIFLDEIGELPLELQPKLLRIIQEGELERLGSAKTIKVDVRLIAATNRNMAVEVEKGTFRADLWYRLNVFPITLPPLRQRKEDIPLMVEHFARVFSKKVGKSITSISSATMQKFQEHSWPGNVRELSNVVERALVTASGTVLHVVDQFEKPKDPPELSPTLEEIEREHITRILDQTEWRVEGPRGAARILGLNASTLRARIGKLGIQKSVRYFAQSSKPQN